jgi:dolichol-phosphate mannosyltransferase
VTVKTVVVVPTYNEKENLRTFVPTFFKEFSGLDLLVVDDNSPDGTAQLVRDFKAIFPQISLLVRQQKQGLGPAYEDGFKAAIRQGYDLIVQMDADFSHSFSDLRRILNSVTGNDFVVGARWIKDGKVANWSWWRRLLSYGGNKYVQLIMGSRVHDWTGGFNAWRRHVLLDVIQKPLSAQGYCFQVELKWRALRLNFRPVEVPIVFEERRAGQSKMSLRIIIEALLRVWVIRFR